MKDKTTTEQPLPAFNVSGSSTDGLILSDGSILCFPHVETGAIFWIGDNGEMRDEWRPSEPNYAGILALFLGDTPVIAEQRPQLRVVWFEEGE